LRNSNTSLNSTQGKRRLFKCAVAGLTLLFLAAPAHAIDSGRTLSQYIREYWGSDRGFPGGSVTAIAQSRDGYLWIGTEKGLARFDGVNFRLFEQANPGSFSIGGVQALQTDNEGNLWILLQNTGILRYRDGEFEPGPDQMEFGITAIGRRRNGAALFSSLAFGLLMYRAAEFEPLPSATGELSNSQTSAAGDFVDSSRSPFFARPNSALLLNELPKQAVTSIAESADGTVWLGTQAKGLFNMTQGRYSVVGRQLTTARINCLLPLENGELWIGTDKGLKQWTGSALTVANVPPSLRRSEVLTMIRDQDANIWVGTNRGLFRMHGNTISLDEHRRANSGPVTALFEDREANLWVGGPGGIERLRDSAFVSYSVTGLQSGNSGPIYVDQDGRVWFAPSSGGLRWFKGGKSESVTKDSLNKDVVYSITGSKDELWMGRQRGGLTRLRYRAGSISTATYTQIDGLAQNSVYAVYRDRRGSIWAATLAMGISEYKDGHFITHTRAQGMASDTAVSIAEGPDETMWFATPNGLNSLSKGRWHIFTVRDGMPSDNVTCLLFDSAGVLWIGTDSGLAFMRSGHVQVPKEAAASLRDQILGIVEDKHRRLWIATSNHILAAERDKLLDAALGSTDVREYQVEDGLLGTQGVKRETSVFADAFGRVWFSTNRGLSVVDTARVIGSGAPAIPHIEGVFADSTSILKKPPVRIAPGTHRVTFSYSGLSLAAPERVRFRYKLDGFDQHWSEPVAAREAVYGNLNAGSYRFRVIASNRDGIWSEESAILEFSVPPIWYQTVWFVLLCTVSGILVAWTLYRLRLRQIAIAMSRRFDERLAERTRIARELHDTFLQTIQGSKLVADDALDPSSDHVRMRRAMEQLSVWLGRAMHEGRTALNSLRMATTQTNDLAEGLRRMTEDSVIPSSMAVALSVVGNPREMHPIVRDEVYRIGYEAIRNACAHSGARRLEIELRYENDITLCVRDNGTGIDPAVADTGRDGHFGLQGMRERAARIGGKLTLVSSSNSGTEIRLIVPGDIIFRKRIPARRSLFTKIRNLFR